MRHPVPQRAERGPDSKRLLPRFVSRAADTAGAWNCGHLCRHPRTCAAAAETAADRPQRDRKAVWPEAPAAADIIRGEFKTGHAVGDTIGRWRIFFISDDEIIAGGDDKHQNFRVSVLRERGAGSASVVVTTICTVHNAFGKIYLFFVVPFHRYGVRKLMSNALAAQRL